MNIVDQIAKGADAALVSDAGTPQVSDPGHLLIQECLKRQIIIVPIPGPSALTALLSVADFPVQPSVFYGFLPKKKGRETSLRRLAEMRGKYGIASVVIYESPERVIRTLGDLGAQFGADTHVIVGRELTKHYEELWYGSLAEATTHFATPRGEFAFLLQLSA
jgi:16S rRNA (cytidine1402-2'-O)-methyltransferase